MWLRHQADKILLDFFGRLFCRKAEPSGEPFDVGIHDDSLWSAKNFAQNNIGRLSADPWQLRKCFKGVGYFPSVVFKKSLCTSLKVSGFGAVKTCGLNQCFQFQLRDFRIILSRPAALK